MDGVLADMEAELLSRSAALFGSPLSRRDSSATPSSTASAPSEPPQEIDGDPEAPADPSMSDESPSAATMTSRQERRLWRHVATVENFWETLKEIEPGAVSRLAALAASRRWEVIFLTKRPATSGATAQIQSQRWLVSKGFELPSVYVVQGSRGLIAKALALDFVIDDRPENCLDVVVDSKARAILVWRESQGPAPVAAKRLGIGIVKSVAECLDILSQADAEASEKPGVLDRVMQLLGLKEPA